MPVYMNGKKVKDLYFGGRKIKEAWYNGEKVYTSFTIPPQWHEGDNYQPGDVVGRIDATAAPGYVFIFECKPGATYPGFNPPYFYYGHANSDSNWEFLEKVAVSPYPPANYREYN